jgi:SAM-dependent methyltransferase
MLYVTNPLSRPEDIAAAASSEEPRLTRPVSQACTAFQFREEAYGYWCREIGETPRHHRKQWEFCYILQALATTGKLAPGFKAVGFGVGTEPLTALFARRGVQVTATDQTDEAAQAGGWVQTNEYAENFARLNERGICPQPEFDARVTFRHVDMNDVPEDLNGYDFCWSACALEHLGSIKKGIDFIHRSLRLLRPGGVAVHTTELKCGPGEDTVDDAQTVILRESDFRRLQTDVRSQGHRMTCNFELGAEELDRHVDVAPYSVDNHLKLRLENYVTTSFGVLIQKAH